MKTLFARSIAIVGAVLLFASCHQNSESHKEKEDTVIQNTLGNLPKFINLPATPTEVKWQTEQLGGDNWSLTAMLQFTKTDFDKIVSQSSKHETQSKPKLASSYLFGLLPETIQSQYSNKKAEESVYVDAYTITPDVFVDVNKSPLVNGDAVVFEDEQVFLLHLYTM
jgi:hypothetical protein